MIYGFVFCRRISLSNMRYSIGSTNNFWKSHLSHTKCNWLAIASWLAMVYWVVNANTYTYKNNNDFGCIPANAKSVDNIE
jgi:hypothetical protein